MTSPLRIIVTGLIAQHPTLGGVTWDYLQYVLGLARLGHDVYYIEDSGQWPYNLHGGPSQDDWIAHDPSENVNHLAAVMARYGLQDRWAYRFPIKPRWYGLSSTKRRDVMATADLLLNVSGTLKRPGDYRQVPRLAYIDSDPVFTQVKLNLRHGQIKFQKRVAEHDVFFSFGECLADRVPTTPYQWRPTRTPIVLSEWRPEAPRRNVFTTVMSWTSYKPLTHARQSYGQKDVEFHRFLDLPATLDGVSFEVSLNPLQHVNWQRHGQSLPSAVQDLLRGGGRWTVRELLEPLGWQVADAVETCGDLDRYRRYIESSFAEWSVAKNGYVAGQSGWFSCRSACYLAAGRPVVVQDTGFRPAIPTGEGVLVFSTPDEAVAAVREVKRNYARHARAARAIAHEFFDSDKVLSRLVDEAMCATPAAAVQEASA